MNQFQNNLMKSLYLWCKTNDEVDELMRKVESSGGKVIDEPGTYQGYYGATFADPDGHKYNFLVC